MIYSPGRGIWAPSPPPIYLPGMPGFEKVRLECMPLGAQAYRSLKPVIPPISGPFAWYDANQKVYKDLGTTLCVNGDTTEQWNDLSGNGHHLKQTNSVDRPSFTTNIQNGLSCVQAVTNSGQGDSMITDAFTAINDPTHIFLVFSKTGGNSTVATMLEGNTVNTLRVFVNASNNIAMAQGGGAGDGAVSLSTFYVVEALFKTGTNNCHVGINGASGSGTITGASPTRINIFCTAQGSNAMYGYLGEIIVYNSELTSANATLTRKYLYSKWGITGT